MLRTIIWLCEEVQGIGGSLPPVNPQRYSHMVDAAWQNSVHLISGRYFDVDGRPMTQVERQGGQGQISLKGISS